MASIAQKSLFEWNDLDNLGDLDRLALVLATIPDEALMKALEEHRGNGRDDYPIRAMWNSYLAGIVFQHASRESLRRELLRNGQLRQVCGFDPTQGTAAVPSASAYSRFLSRLMQEPYLSMVKQLFQNLVEHWYQESPEFGQHLGIDGKAISSYAVKKAAKRGDRRGEHDADWGIHEQFHQNTAGESIHTVKKWFGFTLHLVADTTYELPIGYKLTKASCSEQPVARTLIDELFEKDKEKRERARYWCADRGYDSSETIVKLWSYGIKPIIDIRNLWKDGDATKVVPGHPQAVYDYKGTVSCCCPATGKERTMAYRGFEQDREALKYACPAQHYGYSCEGADRCPMAHKAIRIPLSVDRRIFTPLPRSSYAWKRSYNERSALERINSRLDRVYGFEVHTHRGITKMETMILLAFIVMHSMALGRYRHNRNQKKGLRSLVQKVA